jgi:hypothetical protein
MYARTTSLLKLYIRNMILGDVGSSVRRPWPIGTGLSCIFEGMLAALFHKLVVVEVAGERQVLFS